MKVVVVGLGAVGGLIAARLALAGHAVSALARGATLARVAEHGIELESAGRRQSVRIAVSDSATTLGEHELVVVALKAPALAGVAAQMQPLIGAHTILLPAMNGVPWWFKPSSLGDEPPLASVDPDGRLKRLLPIEQVLGCVVHLACSSPAPGQVVHGFGDRLIVGEPGGGVSKRVQAVCAVLASAGFQADASADVRQQAWYKLWGNLTMNPVSVLTGATADAILDDPLIRDFMLRAMAEAAVIGERIGCPIAQSGEDRLDVARQLGAFRTSMLQDLLAGRPLEIDAIVTAVHEIGGRVGVAMPNIDALLGLTRLMARQRGLYPTAADARRAA